MVASKKKEGIDRESFEPAYMQIVGIVSRQIADGLLRPGDQIPTESQICTEFRVSPMTVRRAVNILVKRGVVSATQGKGTFVRPLDIGEAVFRLQELKEHWTQGGPVSVRLLEASILSADASIAAQLAISPGDRAVYIRRLVLNDDVPTMYHREYVIYDPRRPLVETQLQITSLEGLFQGNSPEGFSRGNLTINAVNATEEEAYLLQLAPGSAVFRLEHILFDFNHNPVSWGWFICRRDHFCLTTQIGAAHKP